MLGLRFKKAIWRLGHRKLRRWIVEKSDDESLLMLIAQKDSDATVRCSAVDKVKEQATLTHIAHTDSSLLVRQKAVGKIIDEKILLEILAKDGNRSVQREAVKRISSESLINFAVNSNIDLNTRILVIENMDDHSLSSLVQNDHVQERIRHASIHRIKKTGILRTIRHNTSDEQLKNLVLKQEILVKLRKKLFSDEADRYLNEALTIVKEGFDFDVIVREEELRSPHCINPTSWGCCYGSNDACYDIETVRHIRILKEAK